MGKLKILKAIKKWALPVLLVLVSFIIIDAQISANPEPSKEELASFLEDNSLTLAAESVDGYQQIYYTYNNIKIFITKGPINHTHPTISGQYAAWVETIEGFPQIFLYDLIEKTKLQVTQTGTNLSPSISGNKIVWEGLDGGVQQVFYFDGYQIYQLSYDFISLRPKIKDSVAVFAQYTGEDGKPWRVISYDLTKINQNDATQIVKEGFEPDSWPSFTGEGIKTSL